MPTITITPEQQAAFQRGEAITLTPPKPEPTKTFTLSLIPNGSIKQRWHTRTQVGHDEADAVERWLADDRVVSRALPARVVVAENDPICPMYTFRTSEARYFQVSQTGTIRAGV